MSFLFGSQKSSTPTYVAPSAPNLDQNKIAADEKKKLRQGAAARTTLLTGPQGLLEPAPVGRKQLLGE